MDRQRLASGTSEGRGITGVFHLKYLKPAKVCWIMEWKLIGSVVQIAAKAVERNQHGLRILRSETAQRLAKCIGVALFDLAYSELGCLRRRGSCHCLTYRA
jgi:hypothetical protein